MIIPFRFLLILGFLNFLLYSDVFNADALSPSFERRVASDYNTRMADVVDQMRLENSTYPADIPLNIAQTTYTSDGENINATLWLFNGISDSNHSYYAGLNLTYNMLLELPLVNRNLDDAYLISIYPEKDGTWTRRIVEREPSTNLNEKILEYRRNYTGFYEDGKRYIELSLNLKSIGYPDKYRVSFYTHVDNYKGIDKLEDWSPWDTIPPGAVSITYDWPSPTRVRAGEVTDLTIPINALGLNEPRNLTLRDANTTDKIGLFFDPPYVIVPLNGTAYTKMSVFVDEGFDLGNRINIQTVNISSTAYNETSQTTIGVPFEESQSFSALVFPSFSITEKINNSINNFLINYYGIYILPLGITSIFAAILSRRIDTKSVARSITISDLLTLNGSIIAGVLIFLTLGGTGFIEMERFWQIGILTASIVYPFALSAIITLTTGSIEKGIKFIIPGFVYLMVSIVLIVFVDVQVK